MVRPRRLRLVVAAVVVLVVVGAGVLTAVLLRSPNPSTAADVTHTPACTSGVALTVLAAEAIAPVVTDMATTWTASHPVVDGACPTVTVRTSSSATAEAGLIKPDVTLPDVWIPDSSLWIQRLRSDTAGLDSDVQSMWLYPSLASSPIVLATTTANASALTTQATKGWANALTATDGVRMIDPTSSTDGLLALLTAQSLISPPNPDANDSSTPSRALVSAMVKLTHGALPDANAGFLELGLHPAGNLAFPASEQEVSTANTTSNDTKVAVAVYPSGKSLSLDFPVAQFAPPGGDPARRDAAVQFLAQLSTPLAQQRLTSAGLRAADGAPLPVVAPSTGASGGAPQPTPTTENNLARPSANTVSDGLRVWTAAGRESRTLLVIDTSGSMSDTIGGGQSKIQFAAKAERAAIDFFPDTSSLGLWTFAAHPSPQNDWTQVVSLGSLGSKVSTATRRQALIAASSTLPGRAGGDTGLYNTALAAYEAVRSTYDPAQANSVVLLTDGANTQTSGIDLATLLSRLRSETRAEAPLPIITIAVGKDADQVTLKKISAATGGTMLVAAQPDDIRNAVLDALVSAA